MTENLLAALRDVILTQADFHSSNAVLMDECAKGAITPVTVKCLKQCAAASRKNAANLREVLAMTEPKAEAAQQ